MGIYVFETGKIAGSFLAALALAAVLTAASNRIFAHREFAAPGSFIAAAQDEKPARAQASAQAPATSARNVATVAKADGAGADKPASAAVMNESRSADAGALEPVAPVSADSAAPADVKSAALAATPCQSCDASEKAVVAKAGPPLFAIVERSKSSLSDLARSNAVRAEEANWSSDDLDQFLAGPTWDAASYATKRANIVEYLRGLTSSPLHRHGK